MRVSRSGPTMNLNGVEVMILLTDDEYLGVSSHRSQDNRDGEEYHLSYVRGIDIVDASEK